MVATYIFDGRIIDSVVYDEVELVETAELGAVGQSSVLIDDPTGTLDIVGLKRFIATENDCSDERTLRGFVGERTYERGVAEASNARQIRVTIDDLNDRLSQRVIRGRDGKRPRESVGDRVRWLLENELDDFVVDHGRVHYPDSPIMDKQDTRNSYPGDVLAECAMQAGGYNYYVYQDPATNDPSLCFRNDNAVSSNTSIIKVSNLLSSLAASSNTFAPLDTATLSRDPEEVFSHVVVPYKRGSVRRIDYATASNYARRDGVAPNANIKRRARARHLGDLFLQEHSTEQDSIEVEIIVPSTAVNLVRAGDVLPIEMSHWATEGYGAPGRLCRVLERRVKPQLRDAAPAVYNVALRLSPQEAVEQGCGEASLVQFAMFNHPSDTSIVYADDLGATPTAGSLMILGVAHHDENAVGPLPTNIPGWTRVPADGDPTDFPFARDDGGSGLSHCDLWYRVMEAGDTGVNVGSDCMKIIAEFTGPSSVIGSAKAQDSGNNNSNVSITSGTPGTQALVIAAVVTRQDDTGRITDGTGTSKMPTGSGAPPSSTGVGHTCLYLLWANTTNNAVTLSGTMTGANNDPDGPWWGARLAAFGCG